MGFQAIVREMADLLAVVALPSFRSCLLQIDIHRSSGIRCLWARCDMCGLTGSGGSLWFGLANHLTHVSDTRVPLASGSFQLCKASVEVVEISDHHLPCCQAVGKGHLSENLLQDRIGKTPNVYVLECRIVKTGSAHEHFEPSRVVLCRHAGCHFELVKLCMSHLCLIQGPKVFSTLPRKMSNVCI